MIGKIMYLCRKYRDEIIFGKLLENLLDMKKPPKKSVVFILRRGRDSNSWSSYPLGSLANYWFKPLTHLSGQLNLNIAIVVDSGDKSK